MNAENENELELDDQDPGDFTYDENDAGLLDFTEIPVMSNDGAYEGTSPPNKDNELKEDEHEDMVLDRGNEYKMVSIMRQKGRVLVNNPYDDPNRLTQIKEEGGDEGASYQPRDQIAKWTQAVPRFGGHDEDEVRRVTEEEKSEANDDSGMAFDD